MVHIYPEFRRLYSCWSWEQINKINRKRRKKSPPRAHSLAHRTRETKDQAKILFPVVVFLFFYFFFLYVEKRGRVFTLNSFCDDYVYLLFLLFALTRKILSPDAVIDVSLAIFLVIQSVNVCYVQPKTYTHRARYNNITNWYSFCWPIRSGQRTRHLVLCQPFSAMIFSGVFFCWLFCFFFLQFFFVSFDFFLFPSIFFCFLRVGFFSLLRFLSHLLKESAIFEHTMDLVVVVTHFKIICKDLGYKGYTRLLLMT